MSALLPMNGALFAASMAAPDVTVIRFLAKAWADRTGSAGSLSWKERDRVRCVTFPEIDYTSPQPSPSRRGSAWRFTPTVGQVRDPVGEGLAP
ncbi:hypothetical protein ASF32_01550 [Methylobacterium sp. Leaf91]|nr:hypothetical protein ASF24_08405 [Methylobacterium sp. Leaf86]KQP00591.1 hypothetical protein ASF32_01550 [Methylobacterium sp. Leaf91]